MYGSVSVVWSLFAFSVRSGVEDDLRAVAGGGVPIDAPVDARGLVGEVASGRSGGKPPGTAIWTWAVLFPLGLVPSRPTALN